MPATSTPRPNLCLCGCGAAVANRYLRGHQFRRDPEERFWEKVDKTDSCWLWTGSRNKLGYGNFWDGHRIVGAYRFAYELIVGPIPDGLVIDTSAAIPRASTPSTWNPSRIERTFCVARRQLHGKRGRRIASVAIY
jgi:hypothetical protein